jgi:hypothetical protein
VVVYNDNADYLKARVIDTSGAPTIGTEVEISDDEVNEWSVAAFDSTHFVAVYNKINAGSFEVFARAGSISGTTITLGTEISVDPFEASAIHVESLDATAALITIGYGSDSACIVTELVLPAVLSVGSLWVFYTGDAAGVYSSILSQYKAVIHYVDGDDSNSLKSRVAHIAGTTVTYGSTTYTVTSDAQYSAVGKALDSTTFICAYDNQTDSLGQAIIGNVSGDTISFGSEYTWYSGTIVSWHSLAVINGAQVVIAYDPGPGWGFQSKGGRISGTVITWDSVSSLTGASDRVWAPQIHAMTSTTQYTVLAHDAVAGNNETKGVTGTHDNGGAGGTRTGNVFVGAGAGGGGEVSTNVCIGLEAGANEVNDSRLYIDISNTAAPLIYGEFDDRNLGMNTVDMAGGEGVIAIANASVVPSGTPTGGGVLYVESGALKYKGSSGTVTTLGVA